MNGLQQQLQAQRFLHGIDYVQASAGGLKVLNSGELAHLNCILTGSTGDPWRLESAVISIPTGQTHEFNVLHNPVSLARDILSEVQGVVGSGDLLKAAHTLYTQLVLRHLFRDANRRTAALGTLWLVLSEGGSLDATELDRLPVGDLRNPQNVQQLHSSLNALIRK
jgi:hypothetical protein